MFGRYCWTPSQPPSQKWISLNQAGALTISTTSRDSENLERFVVAVWIQMPDLAVAVDDQYYCTLTAGTHTKIPGIQAHNARQIASANF